MKILVLSDTHQTHRRLALPPADLLVFAGDAGIDGTREEIEDFVKWMTDLPYRNKVCVGGNHDEWLEEHPDVFAETGVHFLWDRAVEVENLRVYGSPWRVVSEDRMVETEQRIVKSRKEMKPSRGGKGRAGFMITETWAEHFWRWIPDSLDLLVTHQPPYGILDFDGKKRRGSPALLAAVTSRSIRYHVFGHVHPEHGIQKIEETTFINASICDDYSYDPVWSPIVLEI